MKNIHDIQLADILPESILQDKKFSALAAALSTELQKLSADIKQCLHLPRLDELEGTILDLLMYQLHVDFAEPLFLDDQTKRNLIRQSLAWHSKLGTISALKLVNKAFNRDVSIQEWYEYGGEPYHFKIETQPFYKLSDLDSWTEQLWYVKNVRSWCDLVIHNSGEQNLFHGMAQFHNGRIIITPPIHYEDQHNLRVGMAQFQQGRIIIAPPQHNPVQWDNYVALAQVHFGKIFIRPYPAENINHNLKVGLAQIHEGKVTIPSLGRVTEDDDFIKIIETDRIVIIERNKKDKKILDGDILILYFRFPRRDRWTTIKNPRPDLTRDDIKQFGDYVRDNKILTNIHGEFSSGIFRADLIKTHETILF